MHGLRIFTSVPKHWPYPGCVDATAKTSDDSSYHRASSAYDKKLIYFVHRHFHIVIIEEYAIYLDVKGNKFKKTGCNLWGITVLLNTSLPLAPPCSGSADLDTRRPSPRLKGSSQCPYLEAPPQNPCLCSFLRKELEGHKWRSPGTHWVFYF